MPKEFHGVVNVDARDSVPDWTPYKEPKAPEGAPNVLMIVLDDVGYSAMSCYGGLIETPNIDRLAENGLLYTQWHTTALCSPTRACLLTGRNHTTVGMACIAEATTGFPNSNGHIPFECATLAEVLLEQGYNTYMLGKWHLCPQEEMHMASTKRNWPGGRGFEQYYGFLGGETNQWYPALVSDNHPVAQPKTPEEGYHLTEDLTDRAIEFIQDAKQINPDKPFFMYYCPGATHAPHHAPKDWIEKYRGRFDMGYERCREMVLERQKQMGIVPENTELPPLNPIGTPETRSGPEGEPYPELDTVRPWDSLKEDEKNLFCRMAEVYAGFLAHTDAQIGRLIDFLEESGELENTLIVLVSDNGASAEGGPNGSVNENKFFNGIPDSLEENLKMLDDLGSPKTYNHYCSGWAMAFNTPFKMWKRYCYAGGISDACIFHWPRGIRAKGEKRHQYHHAIDVAPTILECIGITMPDEVKGYTQWPFEGISMGYSFGERDAPTRKTTQFYSMLGSRGSWHNGWKAVTTHPTIAGWGHFTEDTWELYHVEEDRSEIRNLAEQHPHKLLELIARWWHEAGKYKGLPLEDRTPPEVLTLPRPQPAPERNLFVYYPKTAPVPEGVAVNIRNRSYTIAADVDVPEGGGEGVLLALGSRFGGHALYVKENRLHYVYNFVGIIEQHVVSEAMVPAGRSILSASFVKDSEEPRGTAHGTLTLYINDIQVGEARIKTQPGYFDLAGKGLSIGRHLGEAVTDDYPGEPPWAFTGTIHKVMVDVTGEPYVHLEKEAAAMMARE
ncbi:arylsulfatase [Methanoculleus sp. FWC-SCC1]|uniref:Arylsulfatase n=1 Tax=Methanoculleus frigidifontis TaxID=2584085 RepID=A0ABT8MDK3_9EURY|nr:arylsulfatase [Methanoculleus sp. FWC-SCC1]MDN7026022.1 arylsulfatase [Methanoculleus sp. FWC-SCC1]